EILTGRCPFGAETPLQTMRQIQEQEPVRPGALVPHLDHDLETICLKCLDKEPQGRYGSAEALAEDLERWLAGRPIQARRCSRWEQLRKWARRRPTTAALLATVFLVSAVGLVGVFWSWRAAEEARHQLVLDRYYDRIALAEREWSANNASPA